MIEKNEMKRIIEKIIHPEDGSLTDHQIMHPAREWFLGLFVGFIMLGVGGFWSVNSYAQFNKDTFANEDIKQEIVPYKGELVKSAKVDFEERVSEYERLKKELSVSNKPVFVPTSTSTEELTDASIDVEESVSVESEEEVIEENLELLEEVEEILEEDEVPVIAN